MVASYLTGEVSKKRPVLSGRISGPGPGRFFGIWAEIDSLFDGGTKQVIIQGQRRPGLVRRKDIWPPITVKCST